VERFSHSRTQAPPGRRSLFGSPAWAPILTIAIPTYTSTPHRVNHSFEVYFGGVLATTSYQGSAGYPGVDIINLQDTGDSSQRLLCSPRRGDRKHHQQRGEFPIHQGGGTCVDPTSGPERHSDPAGARRIRLGPGWSPSFQTNAPSGGTVRSPTVRTRASRKYTGLLASATGQIVSPGGCVVGPDHRGVCAIPGGA